MEVDKRSEWRDSKRRVIIFCSVVSLCHLSWSVSQLSPSVFRFISLSFYSCLFHLSAFFFYSSHHTLSIAVRIKVERLSGFQRLHIYSPWSSSVCLLQYSPGIERFESKDQSVIQMWTERLLLIEIQNRIDGHCQIDGRVVDTLTNSRQQVKLC